MKSWGVESNLVEPNGIKDIGVNGEGTSRSTLVWKLVLAALCNLGQFQKDSLPCHIH